MKNLFSLLVLMVLAAACQHQTPPAKTITPVASSARPTMLPVPADSLLLKRLAKTTDFSPLLQTVQPNATDYHNHAQNGFFGPTHYRIEMATTQVVRDTVNPALYHVRGLSRYKKFITPFVGTLTISKIVEQPYYSAAEIADMQNEHEIVLTNDPGLFSALGTFELHEDSTRLGAGIFRGQLAIDWKRADSGQLELYCRSVRSASHESEVRYEGTWTSYATHRVYPVKWLEDIAYEAEQVLPRFNIGEREMAINPKYARLGWPEFWENEEWWAENPKPALNL